MMMTFGFIPAYTVLIAIASVIEVATSALVIVHGVSVPTGLPALAGLGIGVLTGVGSII